jgi:hypothetical protein
MIITTIGVIALSVNWYAQLLTEFQKRKSVLL